MTGFDDNKPKGDGLPMEDKVVFDSIFESSDFNAEQRVDMPQQKVAAVNGSHDILSSRPIDVSSIQEPTRTQAPVSAQTQNVGSPPKKFGVGKKILVAALCATLGSMSLGLGISLGGAVFSQSDQEILETKTTTDLAVHSQPNIEHSTEGISIRSNNVTGIVKEVSDAVVSINLTMEVQQFFNQAAEQSGSGSGIIFDMDDEKVYIATNNHVITEADRVTISLDDSLEFKASFVGADPLSDLAVISVSRKELDDAGVKYKAAKFGDSEQLEVGDEVVAIGNAMGEGKTATSGIVSALNKQIEIDGKTLDVIQTDAAINPGNSGGALANANGEVIGINTAKLSSSQVEGMGYSIPSNVAGTILYSLKENGSVKKPYLGIEGQDITKQIMDMYNFPDMGVYVVSITEGSGAEAAGIRPRDIIVGYNGLDVESMSNLQQAIADTNVGDTVTLYLYRGNIMMNIDITIGDLNVDANF
ncbi:MAG: trypsin-like peptidase domain-containing protein [Clostridiales bacterium]|jgi:serine protease Do|nr:trypsin-like peptidase domain-containing protein [Clostridiales bacterium]